MRRRDFFKKTQQKRYNSRSFHNPYFREKTTNVGLHWIIGISSSVFVCILMSLVLLWHPMFTIQEVHLRGIQHVDREQISAIIRSYAQTRTYFIFHKQNRFLFNSEELKQQLNTSFTFRDLQMTKKGSQIYIEAVERTSQFVWQTNNNWYVVDLDGVVIRQMTTSEKEHSLSILPLFIDRNDVKIQVGDQVLEAKETEAIFQFHEQLFAQTIGVQQTEFDRLLGKWVGVLTTENYRILFDPTGDIQAQAERLHILIKEKVQDPSGLEYIDLRFGDHVYFK